MSSGHIEYKSVIFIKNILENLLKKKRENLIEQRKDKKCPTKIYENTLDFCSKLEYAIKQMENLK